MLLKKKSSSFLTWDPWVHKVPRYFLFLSNCSDSLNVSSVNIFPWTHPPSSHDLILWIPERVLFLWDPNNGLQCVWLRYQPGKMIRFRIWIITVLTVSDEVSSSLSCIGNEISDRPLIYKSCYLFIPLLQSLVEILENLLWWLTWGLVLLYAGPGIETG